MRHRPALHHRAGPKEKVEMRQNGAPRTPACGHRRLLHQVGRPGILAEPGPQRSDRSRRHFSGDCLPTLGLPALAGPLGEQVGSSALRFLTASALEAKRKLEEAEKEAKRRREQTAEDEARLELAVPRSHRKAEQEHELDAVSRIFLRPLRPGGKRKRGGRKSFLAALPHAPGGLRRSCWLSLCVFVLVYWTATMVVS